MRIYPTYRLVLLGTAVVIGIALWLFLNRTPIGMMIRAGVDDRGMLAASGVNVQRVFAVTFAIGAGLAGFAGPYDVRAVSKELAAAVPSFGGIDLDTVGDAGLPLAARS